MTPKRRLEKLEQAVQQTEEVHPDPEALILKAMALPDDHPIKLELLKRLGIGEEQIF